MSKQKNCQSATSFQEDFHVLTSQLPTTTHKALRASGRVYGKTSSESYGIYDQDTQSWRTYQHSLFGGWEKLSEIWPASGMTRNGKLYPHRGLELSTAEIGSGLWPTPRASDGKRLRFKVHSLKKIVLKNQTNGNNFSLSLPELIKLMSGGKNIKTSFVEMMMGLPKMWTDCKCLETAKSFKLSSGSEKE